ncbi:GntR family transcriptional regulator [Paraburkholderia piptadeniae]|uniref:GntR family transcriptional regulator n=1 Tax=Paraburkholderia piptadeniae TaxID=1701573 RepID=A0A1N7SVL3_9BURK|nr:GntR family transcriptional regulator [Paraburkholderia piptadeniae]
MSTTNDETVEETDRALRSVLDRALRTGETVDRTAALIRQQIVEGRLVPGQRLIARDLVEQFGISRGPLREAFRRLAADGLVDLIPNRGATVRRLSNDEIAQVYQIREALEGYAARRAAQLIDQGDNRARFTEIVERGRRHFTAPDFAAFIVDNRQFHRIIVDICENPQLSELIDKYQLPIFMHQLRERIGVDQIVRNSLAEHELIASGILAGDPERAAQAMRNHLRHSADELMRFPR